MIHSVYNHIATDYLKTYREKFSIKTNDKLKEVYRDIKYKTDNSPTYMLDFTERKKMFAVSLKQSALEIKNFFENERLSNSVFNSKVIKSSDQDIVEVGTVDESGKKNIDDFDLDIYSLATKQLTESKLYDKNQRFLKPGEYDLYFEQNDELIEINYNFKNSKTNEEVLNDVADLVNNASSDIVANVVEVEGSKVKLQLESKYTGEDYKFSFIGENNELVELLDLKVVTNAGNSYFKLNDMEATAESNEFIIDDKVKVVLKDTGYVQIKAESNKNKVYDYVNSFVDKYNAMNNVIESEANLQTLPKILLNDFRNLSDMYLKDLNESGIFVNSDGSYSINEDILEDAIKEDKVYNLFSKDNSYYKSMKQKIKLIDYNPMDFVDKKVVSYNNYSVSNYGSPYTTSLYTGLFCNKYC